MLDVRRMRFLSEVAAHGTIAGAARALAFTPSAVSQQISALEREAGVALVERGPSSVRLTDAGRALVKRTEAILAELAAAEAEIQRLAGRSAGALRVASFPTAAVAILPAALERFSRRWPDEDVAVTEADPRVGASRLRRGDVALALLWEYDFVPLAVEDSLRLVHLLDDAVHVILPRGHPAARRRTVRLADLANEAWITSTPSSSCHPFTVRACNAAGFEPRIAAESNDQRVHQRLVAAGVGVALETELSLVVVDPGVVVRPIWPSPPKRRIYAAYRAADEGDERIAAMVNALREGAAAQEPRFAARPRAVSAS